MGGQLGLEILDACSRGRLGILLVGGQLGPEILDGCSRVYAWLLWLGLRQGRGGRLANLPKEAGQLTEGGFGKLEPFLRALGLKAKWGAFWGLLKLFWPVGSLPFWSLVRGLVEALFGLCCSFLKPVKGG